MKSESFDEQSSPEGRKSIEAEKLEPQANYEDAEIGFRVHHKERQASAKRRAERAALATDELPIAHSYLVPAFSMNGSQQRGADESVGSDFRATLGLLLQKKWLIMLCVLVAGIAGAIYIVLSPKIYRAQAVIQVEQEGKKVINISSTEAQDFKAEELPKTIEQSMTSPQLLVGLIQRNDLDKDPEFLPVLKRPVSESRMVEELSKQISVKVRADTWLIDINVQDRSPAMAQKVADLLIAEFIYENFRRHVEGSEMSSDFLLQKAERVKAKLAKSEEALQSFKEQHQVVELGEKENTVIEKLHTLNRMLTEAKAARLKLESDYTQIKKLGGNRTTDLLSVPAIASASPVIDVERLVAEKEAEVAALNETYKHPFRTGAIGQLQQLKVNLDRTILHAAQEVTNAYDSAAATEKKMEEALQNQDEVALQLSRMSIPYNVLHQEVDADRVLYESVLNRLKETDATKDAAENAIHVVSHPLLPERPVSPNKFRILLLSILGGLGLGCGLALLSRALDRSFRTPYEVERQLGVPALADIPKVLKIRSDNDCLVLLKQPGSAAAESFRSLRASLSLLPKDEPCKTILFFSAVPSEGKSFCAINCAVAFAQQGLETLLIDADLRLPSIERVFFSKASDEAPIKGLTEVLAGEATLDEAVQSSGINKLSVLGAGQQIFTPAELLASETCGRLILEATEIFDRVVINSAPIQVVSDALLLARHVQAICLVISPQTSAETVFRAVQKLGSARSKVIGFVFDRISLRHNKDYSYPYSRPPSGGTKNGSDKRWLHIPKSVSPF
jgi:polysaccharide biosynthesis transport protein